MRAILKAAFVLISGGAGLWLLNDAMTFYLLAPSAGLAGGCYTTIELWLGATEPGRIRDAEFYSGFALLLTAVGWPVLGVVRRLRRATSA
jgi:hypothetical protein